MKNEGSTNRVDVQPNISISAPPPAGAPSQEQMQIVPYHPKQVVPIIEEPEEDDDAVGKDVKQVASGNANKLALVNSNNNLELATLGSDNRHARTLANSNNQLVELGEGNGNHKQTIMRNSGNTEQVHIDGVGNNKVTRISNAGNSEQQLVEARPLAVAGHPTVPVAAAAAANTPLVQINMNDVLDRVRAPAAPEKTTTIIQPVVYGLPQSAPLVSPLPSVPLEALSASQKQMAEIASSPAGLMSPSAIRQMAPPAPQNFWPALQWQQQQQQPQLVMAMPAQQQQLAAPYGPGPMMTMMMVPPMFYPYNMQSPMVMAPQVPFVDYHRDRHARHLDRKLHKLRVEENIRRAERRALRKAKRAHAREEKGAATTTPKPTVIVLNHDHQHKQPTPVATTPAPKSVVVLTKEPTTKAPEKEKVIVVEENKEEPKEEEEEEDEEVIEWETVRVPKRRMKSKKSASATIASTK
jgi:hypothetical protein